ncbi:MAG TPA: hypothetical protein ENO08_04470 [Candidatus Eisenbacteria bacterium]|uniref:Lycopene cyclase domain-containing protein n=1 Tax=Eiseniibacteriota bacterium TaxID=2212470 RepID=A0A7V2AUV3_UNCEI|nr:hypothetical protein [Candidatus Eisenbacteria bacterium]
MHETARRIPRHTYLGLFVIAAAEAALFAGVKPVEMYFTPLVWTGYILFVDGLVARRKGESALTARRKEFFISLPLSIVCWYVFEGVNLLLRNWSYHGLPENTAARWVGYAWSYATIFPGIFVTAELVESLIGRRLENRRRLDIGAGVEKAFFFTGCVLFAATLVFPSPYLCPLPWISLLLWFEGLNDRLSIGSFSAMFRRGGYGLFVSLIISGAVCGFLWEFWNFWAGTKWRYSVPYLSGIKIFEMPILGYLGFMPFALECYLMYRLARFLSPWDLGPDVLGRGWEPRIPFEGPRKSPR